MAIAALYDIHGNLPALEAVLQELQQYEIDQVIIGGDVVPGPMAAACLNTLKSLKYPTRFVIGNCENTILTLKKGGSPPALPPKVLSVFEWTANELSPSDLEEIGQWSNTIELSDSTFGKLLFCHASPRNDTDIYTRETKEKKLKPLFEGVTADVVICGHTHMQFDRFIGSIRTINAGSVGMPFGKTGAYWLLIDQTIQLMHTKYDLEDAARRIRLTEYPEAEEFASNNVLSPPSEEEMIVRFNQVEL